MSGFSLVELMVALAVLAIGVSIALPSFQSMSQSSSLRSYANSLAASAQLARSEAIKRNAVVQLCVSGNGSSCGSGGWQQGWIVLAADNNVIQAQPALDSDYVVTAVKEGTTSGVNTLRFQPSGAGLKVNSESSSASAEFRVCHISSAPSNSERKIRVSLVGRTSVETTTGGVCSPS